MIETAEEALGVAIAVVPQGWLCVFKTLILLLLSRIKRCSCNRYAYTTRATQALHIVAGVFAYCHKSSCQVTCDVRVWHAVVWSVV